MLLNRADVHAAFSLSGSLEGLISASSCLGYARWSVVVVHPFLPSFPFDSLRQLDLSVGMLRASGPLSPPFVWSDLVRLSLHDMLRAFEAWIAKEHG